MYALIIGPLLVYSAIALGMVIKFGKDNDWSDNAIIFLAIFWPLVMLLVIFGCVLFTIQDLIYSIKEKFKR